MIQLGTDPFCIILKKKAGGCPTFKKIQKGSVPNCTISICSCCARVRAGSGSRADGAR